MWRSPAVTPTTTSPRLSPSRRPMPRRCPEPTDNTRNPMAEKRRRLIPEDPSDAGLPTIDLSTEDVEPAHTLANDARDELRRRGFIDDEIDDWAREFVARAGAGDVDEFIAWIRLQEKSSP